MCDWSTSSVNPLLECLSYGNHECLPIKELSHTVTNVSSVMNVCNKPLVPDRGGLKNTIGCLLSVIYKQRIFSQLALLYCSFWYCFSVIIIIEGTST